MSNTITRNEAAALLGVSRQRVNKLISLNKIIVTADGQLDKDSVLAYQSTRGNNIGGRPPKITNAKKQEIINSLYCHQGEVTLAAVWKHLPDSCFRLPRNQIADILNACHAAYQQGKAAERKDINDFLGVDFWAHGERFAALAEEIRKQNFESLLTTPVD